MQRQILIGVVAFAASLAAGSATAHHSYAHYDRCQSVSLEGSIESIAWANPHVLINLKTDDARTYVVEWFNLQQLARAGIPTETLQAGDRVVITGSENRDPSIHTVTLLTQIRRTADSWSWSRPFPVNAPNCAA
jgi:hypothetical protein